ncbi:10371_t:CDS:1, partial [Acaulospora morrowiae]
MASTNTINNGIADDSSNPVASYTVSDLLTKTSSLVDTCDYELALQFARRALSMDDKNVGVLEILGTVEIEMGMLDEAKE